LLPFHINGINTPPQRAREEAAKLEGPMVVFYDPTANAIADIYDRGMRKFLGPTEIDKQLMRILNQLAEAGVPVYITAFSGGPIALTRALEEGAQLAPGSTVEFFSSGVGERRARAVVRRAGGKLIFQPTHFLDPINIAQDFPFNTFGGVIGFALDLATGFKFTMHKLPARNTGRE